MRTVPTCCPPSLVTLISQSALVGGLPFMSAKHLAGEVNGFDPCTVVVAEVSFGRGFVAVDDESVSRHGAPSACKRERTAKIGFCREKASKFSPASGPACASARVARPAHE